MLANWITAKQQPASMYHSVKGKWIHESINAWILDHWKPARCSGPFRLHQSPSGSVRLHQSPSGSVRLRRAPSGFEGPRTSAHTHPQSTLHRPSRIATLVRTALGLVVRCGMTMPYYEGPLPSYMPTMVEVGWADGMQAHTLLWHRPCWSVLGQATIMCTALYCHGMKPGPSESSLPPSDGASPLPSGGASLPPSSSSKTTARRLGGGSSGRRSCAKAGHFTMHFH